MDIWSIVNPILKAILYIASFGCVGGILFNLQFGKQLTPEQQIYCSYLTHKSTLLGAVTAVLIILSLAGNLGGDLASVIDLLMLQLAIESKAGVGYSTAFAGFVVMLIAKNLSANSKVFWSIIYSI